MREPSPARRFPAYNTAELRRMLALPGSWAPSEAHAARIRETIAAREKIEAKDGD